MGKWDEFDMTKMSRVGGMSAPLSYDPQDSTGYHSIEMITEVIDPEHAESRDTSLEAIKLIDIYNIVIWNCTLQICIIYVLS